MFCWCCLDATCVECLAPFGRLDEGRFERSSRLMTEAENTTKGDSLAVDTQQMEGLGSCGAVMRLQEQTAEKLPLARTLALCRLSGTVRVCQFVNKIIKVTNQNDRKISRQLKGWIRMTGKERVSQSLGNLLGCSDEHLGQDVLSELIVV